MSEKEITNIAEDSIEDTTMDVSEEERPTERGQSIITDKTDSEVKSLYDDWKDGDLDLQPDFQRQAVWDNKTKSRLIESAILDIPIPTIYLSEEDEGKRTVIDGQQRLTAFFHFLDGKFALRGVRQDVNKKHYKEIDREIQRKVNKYNVRVITFRKGSNPELKFDIFQRLNSGSVSLNPQEMRNCIYRGDYNNLLRDDLSKNSDFRKIMGISAPDKRMLDVEYVLRFAAFYHQTYLKYSSPMKNFLNTEMEKYRKISEADEKEIKQAFKNAVKCIYSIFGDNSFRRWILDEENKRVYQEPKKFNASLYDILMWSFARADVNLVMRNLDAIKEGLIDLMTSDNDFIKSITAGTSGKNAVETRFRKWDDVLKKILSEEKKQERCFSYALKQEFYEKNKTCEICGNQIAHIDDAAMDHIKQYWLGGTTVPENARLVHRYCNNARSRKE